LLFFFRLFLFNLLRFGTLMTMAAIFIQLEFT
jgi:hypothetical protein